MTHGHSSLVALVRSRRVWSAAIAGVCAWLALGLTMDAGSLTIVNPSGASPHVTIQITGTGFDAAAANNEVTFTPASGPAVIALASAVAAVDPVNGLSRIAVSVPTGLPVGSAAVSVRNKITGEVSGGASIQIISISLPEISSAERGAAQVSVRIVGSPNTQFASGSRALFGSGINVHSTTVESPNVVVALISVSPTASIASGSNPLAQLSVPTGTP